MRQCFKKKKAQSLAVVPYYCVYNICIYEMGGGFNLFISNYVCHLDVDCLPQIARCISLICHLNNESIY